VSGIPKTTQGRMLTVAAIYFAGWQSAVLIRVLNHENSGTWFQLWRDAGLNIFGIPWWVLAAAAVALVVVAAIAQPELIPFLSDLLPEIGEAAAEGIDIGAEGAIEQEEAAAANRLQAMASKVNPLGGTDNCAWAAREVDQGLADMAAGRTPEPYAPDWLEPNMPDGSEMASGGETGAPTEADMTYNQALEQEYGSFFQESSMQRIAEQLDAAGNGARGIVRVANASGGHVFNAVNYGGEVFFVDGQTGAVWTSAEQLPGTWGAGNPDIFFLPTAG